MKHAIINSNIFTGDENLEEQNIIVENRKITSVQSEVPEDAVIIDLKGKNISAGLIDIQINGGETRYFSQYPDEETLQDMVQVCHRYGTMFFLPTLISSSQEKILTAIDTVKNFIQKNPDSGVLGMHLEGPFINPEKRGTHNINVIRKATDKELQQIVTLGKDVIKIMTIAPEMLTDEQIKFLRENGIRLSIGHSNIDYETAQKYFHRGIRLITHLFNAMSDFSHRSPGLVGAALDNEEVFTPVILDGHHSYFAADRIAYRCKKNKFILTTDCVFMGHEIKTFKWEDFEARLENNSFVNSEGNLAGSALSMEEAVKNAVNHLHVSLKDAVAMATSRVAKAIGMDNEIGFIRQGFPAKFFVFNNNMNGELLLL